MSNQIAEVKARANAGIAILENYDEIKSFLDENLEVYRNYVVTPDTMTEARAIRARINKVAKSLRDSRIAIKKQIMEQYDSDFAPKMKELEGMAQEVGDAIGAQINDIKTSAGPEVKTTSISFKATGTKEQLTALSKYMKEVGIKFEKI